MNIDHSVTSSPAWNTSIAPYSHFGLGDIVHTLTIALGHEYLQIQREQKEASGVSALDEDELSHLIDAEHSLAGELSGEGLNFVTTLNRAIEKGHPPVSLPSSTAARLVDLSETETAMDGKFKHPEVAKAVFAYLRDALSGEGKAASFSDETLREIAEMYRINSTCEMHINTRETDVVQAVQTLKGAQDRINKEITRIDEAQMKNLSEPEKAYERDTHATYRGLVDHILLTARQSQTGEEEMSKECALASISANLAHLVQNAGGYPSAAEDSNQSPFSRLFDWINTPTGSKSSTRPGYRSLSLQLVDSVKRFCAATDGGEADLGDCREAYKRIEALARQIDAQLTADEAVALSGYRITNEEMSRGREALQNETSMTVLDKYKAYREMVDRRARQELYPAVRKLAVRKAGVGSMLV